MCADPNHPNHPGDQGTCHLRSHPPDGSPARAGGIANNSGAVRHPADSHLTDHRQTTHPADSHLTDRRQTTRFADRHLTTRFAGGRLADRRQTTRFADRATARQRQPNASIACSRTYRPHRHAAPSGRYRRRGQGKPDIRIANIRVFESHHDLRSQ